MSIGSKTGEKIPKQDDGIGFSPEVSLAFPAMPEESRVMKPGSAAENSADYVWAFPGLAIPIHLKLAVVARLRQEMLRLEEVDVAERTEWGGLLLGRNQGNHVAVTDFEPLELDDRQRHFILSESQRRKLGERISNSTVQDGDPKVIGYFRTDLRNGIRLTDEDLSLIQECFSDPDQVFLVMRSDEMGTPMAGFFFWDSGTVFAPGSFMEFPLDESVLKRWRRTASPVIAPPLEDPFLDEPVQAQPEISTPSLPVPPLPERSGSRKSLVAAAALISLFAIGWTARTYILSRPPAQEQNVALKPVAISPLFLSASRTNDSITVVWDPQIPGLADARIGILTIKEGNTQAEFALTRAQLQSRKLIYSSQSDFFDISLEIFSPNGTATKESVLVALPAQVAESRNVPDAGTRTRNETESILARTSEITDVSSARAANAYASAQPRTFIAPSRPGPSRPADVPSAVIHDSPTLTQVAGVRPPEMKAPEFLGIAPRVPAPQPPLVPQTSASQSSGQLPVVQPQANRTPSASNSPVQPPRPVRQVRPEIPPNVAALLKRPVDVQVRVFVDQTGRVIRAEPTVASGVVSQYLATTAANAARLWTFQPARQGNTSVSGQVVLQFTFGPAK